jgi:hypothetical protein
LLDSKFRACTQAVLAPQSGEHALAALRGMGLPDADPQFTRWLQA